MDGVRCRLFEERLLAQEAVRQALQREFGTERLSSINIKKDVFGKPYAYLHERGDMRTIALSWSHTFPCAIAAAATNNTVSIGADVERVRNFRPSTAEAFLTGREQKYLQTCSEVQRVLQTTMIWSLKESFLKSVGTGIRIHPRRIDVAELVALPRATQGTVCIDNQRIPVRFWTYLFGRNRFSAAVVVLSQKEAYTLRNAFHREQLTRGTTHRRARQHADAKILP